MDLDKLDLFKGLEDLDLFSETGIKAPSNAKPSQAKAKASPIKGSSQKATPKALPSQRRGRLAQIEYTTAKGQQIKAWVVRQPRPLGDAFQWWLEKARATYGWYKKEHGFLFKSQEAAEQFAKELLGYGEQQEEGDRTEGTFEIKEAAKKPKASLSKAPTSTTAKATTAKATTVEVQQEQRGERIEGGFEVSTDSPDLWGAKEREAANLAAMRLAATKSPQEMTQEDFAILSQYSGWGGLSIKKYADMFPEGFPKPEERGLIHEYYTPTKIVREVARVIRPYIHQLPKVDEKVVVLEPSAGIGRFVQAARGEGFSSLDWQVVEWSALSARMLQAMRPDLHVFEGPFERWVRANEDKFYGKIGLVLSNPPYGPRGASITEDPNRDYREKRAYAYFLRRGLDLLVPEGMGVFLIPSGFMTGQGKPAITLRETILKRHHLSAAYRLPSGIFPGAELVTDLLFFRARGVELTEVHETDKEILEGRYFELYPQHILGTEVGKDGGEDDQTKKPRWGYQVVGEFERLPELVEREMPKGTYVEATHDVRSFEADEALAGSLRPKTKPKKKANALVSGVTRSISTDTDGLSQAEALAVQLGARVDRYLAALSAQESDEHVQLWPELSASLQAWVRSYGNPHVHKGLNALIKKDNTAVQRFLSAFTSTGDVIEGIKNKPVWTPRFTGKAGDILAVAEWAYRANKELSLTQIAEAWSQQTRVEQQVALSYLKKTGLAELFKGGWCIDGTHLSPEQDYLSGDLWLKYDALRAKMKDDKNDKALQRQLEFQEQRLLKAINPSVFEDIEDLSPRQGWVPLELVTQWINETVTIYGSRQINTLIRKDGIVTLDHEQIDYDNLDDTHRKGSYLYDSIRPILGWINHDMSNFKIKKKKNDDLDEKRLEQAKAWEQSFRSWITASEQRKAQIERTYNRLFKGYAEPNYGNEPIQIARWTKGDIKLHPHQSAGARRILTNRGGMLAFDVGVGKTYTGIAVIARARQEGWCRRPVIVVPNSIAWKWSADIKRVLPDYRVAVIGSKMKRWKVGDKKGQVTSETDTPKDRAEKWTRFQAGEYDVVILTYSALARTRMNEDTLREYADGVEAIKREIKLRQRNAKKRDRGKGDITERQEALLKEGVAAWIAEKMEIPEAWEYDPGIAWDDIGVDMLVVDEAQNFKNLYLPEAREGGVPRFMGNAGEGSNRAWQMDFRCNAVRQKTGGTGIVLLSATPAKNSPLEFYSLLQMIDPKVWERMGIYDPEQFIDRYLKIELKQVIGTDMQITSKSAVVGFKNLHELREVIFRYADFKTAEDVGLVLPEPTVHVIEVDMDQAQERKYTGYVEEIEESLKSSDMRDKAQILGLLARMALVSIHSDLDEGYDWKTAASADVDPISPKFQAMAKRVKAAQHCGHIVFCDNVAAHRWIVQTLVKHGVPDKRIAVLNAVVAKNTADRQRIALEFNGSDETAPIYDVVVANAVAYEGIDLQRRTCEIHHIDLPWEPATLQQRNGRGVRQGNTLDAIAINYYFAKRSQDGMRFNLIQGKRGWMVNLIKSQDRDTNNPGAQMNLGPDEILLMISRDPERTRQMLDALKEKAEAERRAKMAEYARRTLYKANARFRRAEYKTGEIAAQLRAEGEELLEELSELDPQAWPFYPWAVNVREKEILVGDGGVVLYEGLRVGVKSAYSDRKDYAEFGRVRGEKVGVRRYGAYDFVQHEAKDAAISMLKPEHLHASWDFDADLEGALRGLEALGGWDWRLSEGISSSSFSWQYASDHFMRRVWERLGAKITEALAGTSGYYSRAQRVPVVKQGKLVIAKQEGIRDGRVLPFHLDGWRAFLQMAEQGLLDKSLSHADLQNAADFWFARKVPRGILSTEKFKEDLEEALYS